MATSRKMRRQPNKRIVYRQKLLKAISSLIGPEVVKGVAPQARCWVGWRLMLMAVLMAWDDGRSLGERFDGSRLVLREMFPRTRLGGTYQGFIKALLVHSYPLLDRISEHLRAVQPALAGNYWLVNGFCPFAADGSRSECPRTRANQVKLKCAGRKKTGRSCLSRRSTTLARGCRGAIGSGRAPTASGTICGACCLCCRPAAC